MAVDLTLYPKTLVWGETTWSAEAGGTIALRYMHEGTLVEDRTGTDQYSRAVVVTDKSLRVFVGLRDVKQILGLGALAATNLVATLNDGSADTTVTFATMILYSVNGNQPRAVPGDCELAFVHQSAAGSAVPIT